MAIAPPPAAAATCSAGPDWDPIAESHVVVGGQILGWDPAPGVSGPPLFTPVRLHMRIDHVWKGALAGRPIYDNASLSASGYPARWIGSSGACGAFDDDPAGKYAVLGLVESGAGALLTSRLRIFYLDERPYDPASVRSGGGHALGLPSVGHPHARAARTHAHDSWTLATIALTLGGVALAGAAIPRLHPARTRQSA